MSTALAKRLSRLALLALAAWGVLVSVLAASGLLPLVRAPAASPPTPVAGGECACEGDAKGPQTPAMGPPAEPRVPRYAVCDREEAPAKLFELGIGSPALWAVHCGPSVHVLAFEPSSHGLVPRRVMRLTAPRRKLDAPWPGPILGTDVDGDGLADLVVSHSLVALAGAPTGGAVHWLRGRPEGGFGAPTRLFDAAPGDLAVARLDDQPGSDLVLLHVQDAHSGGLSELWYVTGGPAPLRTATIVAGNQVHALATLDLDLDRIDDAVVLARQAPLARLFASSRASEPALPVALEDAQSAVAADLDGDGARELIVGGPKLLRVNANAQRSFEPKPLANGAASLRDLQVIDVDADARADLVGYVHPSLVAWANLTDSHFDRRELASVHGQLGVLRSRVARVGRGGALALVLLTASQGPEQQVEIVVAELQTTPLMVHAAETAQPVQDSALTQRFELP